MLKDITLGQFYPGDSLVHRLDPRVKLVLMVVYIAMVFLVEGFLGYLFLAAFLAVSAFLSRIRIKFLLRSIRPVLFIVVFTFVLNILFTRGDHPILEWGVLHITWEGVRFAVFMSLRLVFLLAGTSLLTLTTSPIALTDGLERLLKPLRRIRFPVHELAMMMSIALRFIPTLLEETERIRKAQMARGADFETGGLLARARALVPLLVPLFVSSFRRADELAMAMESRCYHGGEGRTRMHELHYARRDLAAALVIALTLAAVPVLQLWI